MDKLFWALMVLFAVVLVIASELIESGQPHQLVMATFIVAVSLLIIALIVRKGVK